MASPDFVLTFDKNLQIIKRRCIPALGIFIPVFIISLLGFSLKKPSYEAEGKMIFQRRNTISTLTGVGTEIGKLEPVLEDQKTNPLNTEAEVMRSANISYKVINRLDLKDKNGKSISLKAFVKPLNIKEIKGTDILQISYADNDPEKAAQVVNTLMSIYLEHNIFSHRAEAATARKFIEEQLPKAELVVGLAEGELANFKEKNKVVALQEETNNALTVITELQKQINQAQSQIAEVNAQSEGIRKQLGANPLQAVALTNLSQSPGVQDILKQVQQLESQLAARRIVLQDTHPEVIRLKNTLQALNGVLQQRIKQVVGTTQPELPNGKLQIGVLQQQLTADLVKLESTRLGLVSQAAALSKLQAAYRQRLNNQPRLEQQQRQLERKVQASQSTYSLLLQKLQESRIAENQNIGNASLLSKAQAPEKPISSSTSSYLGAGFLAILAALATIYILEARDKSIRTVDEAKELLGLTLLGVIPSFNKSKKSTRGSEESELSITKLPISEAYRILRANLRFTSADKELKVIVITSSVSKEGKSTVAANLAIAMAQMERKVLLVDGDLHHPIQHHIWELPNSQGLSNVIVGQVDIRTAITKVMDTLDVLTSGVVPPNPASLLDSKRMAALMETFSSNYDFVIIDTPSLNLAADAAALGQIADGVLLVVRPGVVDSVNATFARELLEKSGQNVLGQVVNGVISKNEPYSYYFTEEYYFQESRKEVNAPVV